MTPKTKISNREVALQTAASLFLSKGYLVTSMDDIVAESKVSKTNIYYYFKSKEELLSAIIEKMTDQYEQLITYIASQTELPVTDRLMRAMQVLIEQDIDCLGGCPFLTLYTQTPREAVAIREQISLFFGRQLLVLEQLISQGIASKEINSKLEPKQTAALILSTIEGGLFLQHANRDPAILQHSLYALAAVLK
ncbi:TetR/AcrR family transcriptional regulator [Bacillus sp. FJAT-26390]|uniref:TetR/AcrR family transcriptional regulator n=1 Tax=Bacillus sp. FJAT-26390 TaxID=1743142 RepID=UPI000807CE76|nr:TetR/AcrR family transcriptional regulator [Bacillus sp. FJAT-26390]OBZ11295.1 TetR family transcriptional regulator [Bacillus sp. FJAT-26390]